VSLTEELRIPATAELDFLAHGNFLDISDSHIKTDTIPRNVKKIDLNVCAVAYGHQHFASLLFPQDQPTIEVGTGNLAALRTAQGSSSHSRGDGQHSFTLTCMTFEVYPSTDQAERLCFSHVPFFPLLLDLQS
jgi:hypothetical protein